MKSFVLTLAFGLVMLSSSLAEPGESVDSIKARYESQRQEHSQKLRAQKIELMKLISVDSPNEEHIKKKLQQILETERERQELFVDEMFAVRDSMTEQQWRDYRRTLILMMMNKNGK